MGVGGNRGWGKGKAAIEVWVVSKVEIAEEAEGRRRKGKEEGDEGGADEGCSGGGTRAREVAVDEVDGVASPREVEGLQAA